MPGYANCVAGTPMKTSTKSSADCAATLPVMHELLLREKLDRPHELFRECVLMDQCRDWKLDGSGLEFAC